MTGRGVATLTAARATGPEKLVPRAFLFRVLDCQRLLGASARHALDDTDEVVLGRGDGATERKGRSLRIWVSDSYVSSRHATLTRGDGRWRLGPSSEVLTPEELSALYLTPIIALGTPGRRAFIAA